MEDFGNIYPLPDQNRLLIALSSHTARAEKFVWTQAPFVPDAETRVGDGESLLVADGHSHIFEITELGLKQLTQDGDFPETSTQISFLGKLDTGEILLSYTNNGYRAFATLNPETNQVSCIESSLQNFAIDKYEARSNLRGKYLPLGHPQEFFITCQNGAYRVETNEKNFQIIFQTLMRENSYKKIFNFFRYDNAENEVLLTSEPGNPVFPFIMHSNGTESYLLLTQLDLFDSPRLIKSPHGLTLRNFDVFKMH